MPEEMPVELLVEGMLVLTWEFEGEMTQMWRPKKLVPMGIYLESIGKKWHDLDEAQVKRNAYLVWVARHGTNELPLPISNHGQLSVEPIELHKVVDVKLWNSPLQ